MKVTVFADCGPAHKHEGVYTYVGNALGKKGVNVICPLMDGRWPEPLIDAIGKHKTSSLTFVTSQDSVPAGLPARIKLDIAEDKRAAFMKAANLGEAIVGLPAEFVTVSALYTAWADIGGAQSGRPVGLLNRKQAFEVVKGFFSDVAAVGLGNIDHKIQISENFDDLLNRLIRLRG